MSSSPFLIEDVLTLLTPQKDSLVADVACGMGKWGLLLRIHHQKLYIVGVDLSTKNISLAKATHAYDDLIIADARQLPFRDHSIDYVMACEVIEHLNRRDGIRMIYELERIASLKILLTIPYAVWWYTKVRGHITRYSPKELRKLGFKVRGIGSNMQSKNRIGSLLRHFILKPLAYVIPEMGEFLVAIKEQTKGER
ncbi:MAG: hypothetical protein DRP00_05825 [Candidatus Aenigmatarchaeota archaeon]|nr:MAG: hypothetical protein DRP00_05825 [Candidatus Aenigmarchaeota archaeon]